MSTELQANSTATDIPQQKEAKILQFAVWITMIHERKRNQSKNTKPI